MNRIVDALLHCVSFFLHLGVFSSKQPQNGQADPPFPATVEYDPSTPPPLGQNRDSVPSSDVFTPSYLKEEYDEKILFSSQTPLPFSLP